jgi:hypothetical protein
MKKSYVVIRYPERAVVAIRETKNEAAEAVAEMVLDDLSIDQASDTYRVEEVRE